MRSRVNLDFMWRTHRQLFSDLLDQLDFALDQLFIRDRNHDRFAMMLIDNVVELALHHHAESVGSYQRLGMNKEIHPELIRNAKGRYFEAKVKLAKASGLVSGALADSLATLHDFRNSAHHAGKRHERILNSLAAFYLQSACEILQSDQLRNWGFSSSSEDVVPRRALKYLGTSGTSEPMLEWKLIWRRVQGIVEPLAEPLIQSLSSDAALMVDSTDEALRFPSEDGFTPATREEASIHAQLAALWALPETQARIDALPDVKKEGWMVADAIEWVRNNSDIVRSDPIPAWRKRAARVGVGTDRHGSLKRYIDLIKQTEQLRGQIHESAVDLDGALQHALDVARGK